jgi:hypothetical protein
MAAILKIEISSNGQNGSILSQKVPKFELYKHNDELFNIYYRIFYELWTFTDFDWLCKLEKRGDEILKKSSPLKLRTPRWVIRFTSKLQVKKKMDRRVELPDTFLEENHPMTISSKFCSYWANGFRQKKIMGISQLSLNFKNLQHVKIFLPYNFEVNPITHFGVIGLFSSKYSQF